MPGHLTLTCQDALVAALPVERLKGVKQVRLLPGPMGVVFTVSVNPDNENRGSLGVQTVQERWPLLSIWPANAAPTTA
jgi:hypothetical protein